MNSILFAGPHLWNPEMSSGALLIGVMHVMLGAFLMILAVRDNRLELALGAHAANNLTAALLVNHPNSSLPTQAVWQVSGLDPVFIAVSFLITAPIFVLILTRPRPLEVDRMSTGVPRRAFKRRCAEPDRRGRPGADGGPVKFALWAHPYLLREFWRQNLGLYAATIDAELNSSFGRP